MESPPAEHIQVKKSTGESVPFSVDKLRRSLKKSGASHQEVEKILDKLKDEVYSGITTGELYARSYALLRQLHSVYACKYKLKTALYELGPSGFPFEQLIAGILKYSGYETMTGQLFHGRCVTHEVDVVAKKNGDTTLIECKFHSEEGIKCNVKVPLYIRSRFNDIKEVWKEKGALRPWLATNTRFTADALQYGKCSGLYLMSWDYPEGDALRDRLDRLGLYPITVSGFLFSAEKEFLLDKNIVLGKQLLKEPFMLDHAGLPEERKARVLEEFKSLCNHGE
ncbi:restriction endonuclease [Robertkochia aurantiaca]|uniref:restriction endonuclease n=1 Tax=Robertkochia aurantiaca TaxID=2873700 RepID=UPI001CC92FE8|nr:restriction endonuclease [Robertkochia sp. 3YJGBD-33]